MNSVTLKCVILYPLVLALFLAAAVPCNGQVWTDFNEHDPGVVSLEVMIPSFDQFLGAEGPTSAYELYTRFMVGDHLNLILSLPVSHLSTAESSWDISETAIGNPYIGIRSTAGPSGFAFEGGVRLPLAPDDNVGIFTGLLIENHALGRFIPETFTLTGTLRYHYEQESGLIFRAGGGPDVWFIKNADAELALNYYTQLLYSPSNFTFGAGFAGLALLTGENISFNDRTIGDIGLITSYHFGNARAGAYFRLPMDNDVNDAVNFVLGIHLGVVL